MSFFVRGTKFGKQRPNLQPQSEPLLWPQANHHWEAAGSELLVEDLVAGVIRDKALKMKRLLVLPHDESGYGDFAVSYVGIELRIQFNYVSSDGNTTGEIVFPWCVNFSAKWFLDGPTGLPAIDTIFLVRSQIGPSENFNLYAFRFGGNDYYFEVMADTFTFDPSINADRKISA